MSRTEPLGASAVSRALRARALHDDGQFDQFLPEHLKRLSWQFWTPLDVSLRVAAWLDQWPIQTVVDIGSGVGKFCVATALASNHRFIGLEHRGDLVDAASELAERFGVQERVEFIHGCVGETPVPAADAYYLFNPFEENCYRFRAHQIDRQVELTEARYARDVAATRAFLASAPLGTYVIKYNGYGAPMPYGYEQVEVVRELPCVLRLWRKVRDADTQYGP